MKSIPLDKVLYLFEVDDILFPKRDYLLQVYYLFANFVEFTEGQAIAKEVVDFMKARYEEEGEAAVLPKTRAHFNLGESYVGNFERLKANAQLPLRLYIPEDSKEMFRTLLEAGKNIALLTRGNPVEQLNKLKHIDWQELDQLRGQLKIYFTDELLFRGIEPIAYIAEEYGIRAEDVLEAQV
ncbi:hypothetical protein [Sphingobacterium psychroaquaticum]|uniref:Uncharacterized protein n=1 Tax=Sphingobacterium psychroaquaticum TaxID=561061 RepID=A0A1X7L8D8_9SPHI|nr:hypothetical protein [Sphingobacterium psychroaquaticum]QBQ42413.1 HAD family hydrolase [Sphingobacterium psychroaquaticum]SMG50106.1 hypothetical protein SAMN05660862_3741 [Sphingobacterium psychroaquaticum]